MKQAKVVLGAQGCVQMVGGKFLGLAPRGRKEDGECVFPWMRAVNMWRRPFPGGVGELYGLSVRGGRTMYIRDWKKKKGERAECLPP